MKVGSRSLAVGAFAAISLFGTAGASTASAAYWQHRYDYAWHHHYHASHAHPAYWHHHYVWHDHYYWYPHYYYVSHEPYYYGPGPILGAIGALGAAAASLIVGPYPYYYYPPYY